MIFKTVKIVVAFVLSWFSIHSIYSIKDGLKDNKQIADVAIVFGNKVNKDGTLSIRLKERLNKSIELYNHQRIKIIIVSGGLGKEGFFEGDKMGEYLANNKIPAESIIIDNNGNDTEKTVENSIKLIKGLGLNSAISISQYFHQTRIKKLFKKNGLLMIESASPIYFEVRDFYSVPREFIAFYKEAL